ncbi:hypothetical protein VTJ04DRAFT_4140 [Mycothermus thermophilus]|uniref:uncharacterized protein n=1 Tax=Humicola insolens TaxID=85995 RepID=UPI0037424652
MALDPDQPQDCPRNILARPNLTRSNKNSKPTTLTDPIQGRERAIPQKSSYHQRVPGAQFMRPDPAVHRNVRIVNPRKRKEKNNLRQDRIKTSPPRWPHFKRPLGTQRHRHPNQVHRKETEDENDG